MSTCCCQDKEFGRAKPAISVFLNLWWIHNRIAARGLGGLSPRSALQHLLRLRPRLRRERERERPRNVRAGIRLSQLFLPHTYVVFFTFRRLAFFQHHRIFLYRFLFRSLLHLTSFRSPKKKKKKKTSNKNLFSKCQLVAVKTRSLGGLSPRSVCSWTFGEFTTGLLPGVWAG